MKLLFLILYVAHICGCIWHFISIWQISHGHNDTWLNLHDLVGSPWIVRYIDALYYAVLTMITTGIINTNNFTEKCFSIFIVLVLSGLFAYAISVIGIILGEMNKNENELRFDFYFNYNYNALLN